jgi:hypothetical protein
MDLDKDTPLGWQLALVEEAEQLQATIPEIFQEIENYFPLRDILVRLKINEDEYLNFLGWWGSSKRGKYPDIQETEFLNSGKFY